MPHHNTYGEDIITLQDAKIVQKNFTVLSHVNLHIKRGTFCYLIGKTGSGKSSLLKVLYGHLPLKEGNGEVVGFDLQKLRASDIPNLRRRLGIVFQDFQLLTDRSVERNLRFVLEATGWKDKNLMDDRINEVLDSVDMKTKKHKMPHELSGGEQQMLAIARALMSKPTLLLMDEPSMGLAPLIVQEIFRIIKKINEEEGTTILLVEQNANMALSIAHKAYVLETGRIILSGDAKELAASEEVRKAYLGG